MKKFFVFLLFSFFYSSLQAACFSNLQYYSVIDPLTNSEWSVSVKKYLPENDSARKLQVVFILPSILGESALERNLAFKFCQEGFAPMIVDLVKYTSLNEYIYNLDVHDQANFRANFALNHIIKGLQKEKIYLNTYATLSISLGGITSAYLAGKIKNIYASVIIVGGGNLAGILAYSDQQSVQYIRNARMNVYGLESQEEYEKLMRRHITKDPLTVTNAVRENSVLMYLSTQDTTVPTSYQKELAHALSKAKIVEIDKNHYNTILEVASEHFEQIVNFIKTNVKLPL